MFRMTLKNNNDDRFIYRWAFECFGKSVELGLSHDEFTNLRRKLVHASKRPVKTYLQSVKSRLTEKRAERKHTQKPGRKNGAEAVE